MGPESIVRCLKELREYSIDLNSMISWNVSELLGEIVDINPYSKKESLKNIYDIALKVWKDNCVPVFLGGDHSITYPIVKAYMDLYKKPICIIQFDADIISSANILEDFEVCGRKVAVSEKCNFYRDEDSFCIFHGNAFFEREQVSDNKTFYYYFKKYGIDFFRMLSGYYNYRKNRKAEYQNRKEQIKEEIKEIYHDHNGVDGYRSMTIYLGRRGYQYSPTTIHKYINQELGLYSIVRKKKPNGSYEKPQEVFKNTLNQDFTTEKINQKWCIDFTYLYLKNYEVRYNCTILDLHDRSVIASITGKNITSDLAIRTLKKALDSQTYTKGELLLHSDRGSQYTSKAFTDFCKSTQINQSMSRAGYPYDNAPMERYFNTLKNECIYLHEYKSEESLYQAVEEFSYVTYNHVRPHSFNGYLTPYQARIAK